MGGTSGPIESLVFGGDDGGGGSTTRPQAASALGASTPNLFKPAQQFMPAEYHGNSAIRNPTAILQAYMQNMPAFLNASRSQNTSA